MVSKLVVVVIIIIVVVIVIVVIVIIVVVIVVIVITIEKITIVVVVVVIIIIVVTWLNKQVNDQMLTRNHRITAPPLHSSSSIKTDPPLSVIRGPPYTIGSWVCVLLW